MTPPRIAAPPVDPDVDALARELGAARGPRFWRSLEEHADSPAFRALLARHLPSVDAVELDGPSRRRFLKLVAASLALAGATSCTRQPPEEIVPYVTQPEGLVPGRPLYFATALSHLGYGTGVLVESQMGRPIKIEGNPEHPASLGATDAITQGAILGLYDPDRSAVITHLGAIRTWGHFLDGIKNALASQRTLGGKTMRILTETVTSPTLAASIRSLLAAFPEARWHQWEPANRDNVRLGASRAFGRFLETRLDLREARLLVTFDADLLTSGPGNVRHARDVAERRRPGASMLRYLAVESSPTPSSSLADARLAADPARLRRIVAALAARLLDSPAPAEPLSAPDGAWVDRLATQLQEHAGHGAIVAGDAEPPAVHALVHAMNARLGNLGRTVLLSEPVEAEPSHQTASLAELVEDMRSERVRFLVVLGANPVFTAPSDLGFAEAIAKVDLRIHSGLHADETAELCHWHVPMAHELESWGDVKAYDGTVTIQQPLIEPLYGGRSPLEILALLRGEVGAAPRELVRAHHRTASGLDEAAFEKAWRRSVHDGVVAGSAHPPVAAELAAGAISAAMGELSASLASVATPALLLRPDPFVHDGRHANSGWLQELPRPMTKLTWDNAALVSQAFATSLGAESGDVVELRVRGEDDGPEHVVEVPLLVLPGQADGTVLLHYGQGRRRGGRVAEGVGVDAYPLRTTRGLDVVGGLVVRRTERRQTLAITQSHHLMENRHLVRVGSAAEYAAHPEMFAHVGHVPKEDESFYPPHPYDGRSWGMSVDLNVCTGCSACTIACQAENNIPVVGKAQVENQREMHWIRVDRYFEGDPADPRWHFQPVMCQHCEHAPCEPVCPVEATVHGSEGLNEMVYNRCVGTRYCANNCPYKVRRFNFLLFNDYASPVLDLLRNPDVTVRSRGVMEKCTYCVQRINLARIDAEREGRPVRDGEVLTACQQVCPTQAIVFGDLNDGKARVVAAKAEPRSYSILAELNTRPRTTYLAKITNPLPGEGSGHAPAGEHGAGGEGHHG